MRSWMKEEGKFFLFISPWVVGFLAFFVVPALTSLIYSFADYNSITAPKWIGFDHYLTLLHDPIFKKSLVNTLFFVFFGTPVVLFFQILFAALLNIEVKGIGIFENAVLLTIFSANGSNGYHLDDYFWTNRCRQPNAWLFGIRAI